MQDEGTNIHDDAASASATSTDHSSPHHQADRDDDASGQSLPKIASNEELEDQAGNKEAGNGYEVPDPREVAEARIRAQQPAEYAGIQTGTAEDLYSIPKKKKPQFSLI